jgi:glutamate--cysteine ligase
LHGIERECLRVTSEGRLAQTPHPEALGSALTNEQITTDYSESLLEFITPALPDPADTLASLDKIHRFAYSKLGNEYLWSPSMPCPLPAEEDIPIAYYGTSNIGQLKYVYRKGLALRYGKTMQCIAGIHYNFSLPEKLWPLLKEAEGFVGTDRDYQSSAYIALIRNFRRYSWLLMYLFGASPALDAGFLRGRSHQLEQLDADTLYLPYATSLRMSDLGYQSNAQAGLTPCYNDLASYTDSLRKAVATPYAPYVEVGTHKDGEWVQLNTNILQIENEYYSNIRPKRVTYTGERPIQALMARGIQYVEVRCLDINPFLPMGIDLTESRFLDAFLLYCALNDSPLLTNTECGNATSNFLSVVKEGRRPGLQLQRDGQAVDLKEWAAELLEKSRHWRPCSIRATAATRTARRWMRSWPRSGPVPDAIGPGAGGDGRAQGKLCAVLPAPEPGPRRVFRREPLPAEEQARLKNWRVRRWRNRRSWNRTKWAISTCLSGRIRRASWRSATKDRLYREQAAPTGC